MNKIYPVISTSNTKLGEAIPSINLPAGITCLEDVPCSKKCYAKRGNFCYKKVKECAMKNYEAYLESPEKYFGVIRYTLTMIPYRYFRYHSSGDIVDMRYLELMCDVAQEHQDTRFLCFTKKYKLVNDYLDGGNTIPENLVIVFSNWGAFICDNPYKLPTSYVRLKKEEGVIPQEAKECNKYCGDCCNTEESCWNLKKNESVVFNQH